MSPDTRSKRFQLLLSDLIGTAGLVSYDIPGTDYKVCVAYYTPFNDIFYDNQFNIKVTLHRRSASRKVSGSKPFSAVLAGT